MKLQLQRDGRALDFDGAVPFGVGGEAAVFAVPTTAWAAKAYHQYVPSRGDKLRVMISNPPDDPTAHQGHVSIAWPQDLLLDAQGRVLGYVMPLVKGMRRMIDFYHPGTRRKECPLFHYYYLVVTARNLATAVRALHRRGYVMGDVNESNILVADTAMVTLVDTDSFQVKEPGSGRVHHCIVGSPLFTPREMQGVDFSVVERREEHDLFGLGVLLFQLLMEGTHPFQVRFTGSGEPPELVELIRDGRFPHGVGSAMWQPPPLAPPFGMLDTRLRGLFTRCFVNGHHDPQARPTADEWREKLVEAVDILVLCKVNPNHRYWPHVKKCPWCERAAKLGGRDPFPSPTQVKSGAHLAPAGKVRQPAPTPTPQPRPQAAPTPQPRQQGAQAAPSPRPAKTSSARKPVRRAGLALAMVAMVALIAGSLWIGWGRWKWGLQARSGPTAEERAANERATAALGSDHDGTRQVFALGGGQRIAVRFIPVGTFTMGSPAAETGRSTDEAEHMVTLETPYWMGETVVTQGQWEVLMGGNPSNFKGDRNLPVENVSWYDAQAYVAMLNMRCPLRKGWHWALPTEAQWEYACRAGKEGAYAGDLDAVAWYSANSGSKTHPVATKQPNSYGLYDMLGNVWEWCADWYGDYPSDAGTDPTGPAYGEYRVYRGSGWADNALACRPAARGRHKPDDRDVLMGFRVAVVSSKP